MKATRAVAIGICAVVAIGAAPRAVALDKVVNVTTGVDTVYTPIRNEVVTRGAVDARNLPELDTLKLQVMNGITSGITTGSLTEDEVLRLYEMMDNVEKQEAQFKAGGPLDEGHVNNLMRKYHMISITMDELASNSTTNDFMPRFEVRRERLMRMVLYHMAAANLTPAEGEQLLGMLNDISDNYAMAKATGNTLTADELEAAHKDLYKVRQKLHDRTCGFIARVVPVSVVERKAYLTKIQEGMASGQLTQEEGAKLIEGYNNLVILEESMVLNEGPRSPSIERLAQEINNLTFILDRQLRDRASGSAIAGSSDKL